MDKFDRLQKQTYETKLAEVAAMEEKLGRSGLSKKRAMPSDYEINRETVSVKTHRSDLNTFDMPEAGAGAS